MTAPTPAQRAVLAAMADSTRMTGREIAGLAYGAINPQTRGAVFLALAEMIKRRWVDVDNSDPAGWTRTPAGTEALAEVEAVA